MTALLCGSDGCYVVRSVPRRSRIGGPFVRTNGRVVLAAAGGPVELENGTNEQISYARSDDLSLNLGSLYSAANPIVRDVSSCFVLGLASISQNLPRQ